MQYLHIYSSPDGESHFEDVEVVQGPYLDEIASDSIPVAAIRFFQVPSPTGEWGPWHPAPARQFLVRLRGELDIQVSDGEIRRLSPGTVMLVEDVAGRGHRGRAIGGGEGQNLFIPLPE